MPPIGTAMKKRFLQYKLLAAMMLLGQLFLGCGAPKEPISKSGFYFNTVITVTLYDGGSEELLDECFALASQYEGYFSATIPDSDIAKINSAGGTPVTVHDETVELLQMGVDYGALSDAAFDITIGALSNLWDISTKALLAETDASMIPADSEIQAVLSTVDYRDIQIDGNEVSLKNPDAAIDLGGIAKGYIADRMKEYLNSQGVTSGHINLGGNVLVLGEKSDGSPYNIGVQRPFSLDGSVIATVQVTDGSVVSSGVYERCFTVDDILYHHILDTTTGYPYDNGLLGVTIITSSSADADALSTICFSLGLRDGMALVESLTDTEAIFITEDYELHVSSGMGDTIPYETF